MLTARPEINNDLALRVKILFIELRRGLLFLVPGRDDNTVAAIVVVEMEHRLVVATVICEPGCPFCNSDILDDHLRVCHRLAGLVTNMPFNDEPVIHLMHGRRRGRRGDLEQDASRSQDAGCKTRGEPFLQPRNIPLDAQPVLRSRSRTEASLKNERGLPWEHSTHENPL
jgi:hypothetical protein